MDTHEQLEANILSIVDTIEYLANLDPSEIDMDVDLNDEDDEKQAAMEAWVAFCEGVGLDAEGDIDETIEQWVSESALEAYETGNRQMGGDWDVDGYVVVFCTGGPHIEVKDGRVEGCWGSARASRGLSPDAAEWLEDRMFGAYR